MVKIIMDDRENKTKIQYYLQNELNCEVEFQRLDVGDYIVSERCVVERKRGDDFAASIFDKRIFDQLVRMKDVYELVILCIEDFDLMFYRYPDKANIFYGALASFSLMGIAIIPVPNEYTVARLLESLARKEQEEHSQDLIVRSNPKTKSHRIRQLYLLQGLVNVGSKKSSELLKRFHDPFNVFKEIVNTENTDKKIVNGSFKTLDGFGVKFIKDNKDLLLGKLEEE